MMIPPRTTNVTFLVSVTDANGCTSAPATVTLGDQATAGAFASVGQATERTPIYIAMGDSYSSGEGLRPGSDKGSSNLHRNPPFVSGTATDLVGKAHNKSDTCHRSTNAYGPQEFRDNLHSSLPALHFLFTACSGALTTNLGKTGQMPESNLLVNGVLVDRQPQIRDVLQYQLDPKKYVRYVSLSAGGNDVDFKGILQHCAWHDQVDPGACVSYADTHGHLGGMMSKLESLYRQLRTAAPYAEIFVLDYPRIFNTGGNSATSQGCFIAPDARQGLDNLEDRLNATIKIAVAAAGSHFHFVELDPIGKAGEKANQFDQHNLCRSTLNGNRSWINGASKAFSIYRTSEGTWPELDGKSARRGHEAVSVLGKHGDFRLP